MPCPHNEISIVQRSHRQSAVAAAAYQSGEKLFCEYDQEVKHYPEKRGIVHNEILLPANAPLEYTDRNTLWNAAEAVEKQWNSQLARRWVLSIPREIPPDQYAALVRDFCRQQFVSKGMCVDFAIHDKGDGNPHAHVMLTMRAMDERGKWLPKSRKVYELDKNGERIKLPSGRWKSHKEDTVDWNDRKYGEIWRHEWEVIQNRYLEANNRPERVDAQMLKQQLAKGNNGLVRTKYITFSIEAKSIREAKPRLERIETDILNNFKVLGVKAYPLNGVERLQIMYETFHQEEQQKFDFSYDRILQSGMTTKDFIAPTSFLFKSGKDFMMGDTYGAASYLNILAPELTDKVLAEFLDMDKNLVVSIHVQSVDQLKAIKLIKGKITDLDRMKIEEQKKAVRSGYDMEIIPSDLATYGGEAKKILDDLQSRNERMFLVTVLFLNTAKTKQELDSAVFQTAGIAQKFNCTLNRLDYLQEQGLMSSLPLANNLVPIKRALTTTSTAIFVPFTTQELFMEGDSLYYGLNAVSNNMIMADRKQLKNPNGLILGTPGSGKSFSAKREITNVFFTTTDDIIVADPEGEYYPLVEALGGQVIHISSTSKDYINPMDINLNYADDDNPLGMKSDFILSLCELIMGARDGMEPEEKSVIDRCLPLVYQKYLNDPKPENMPTLGDLYDCLREQKERQAQRIATALEIYVNGSLRVFNHQTNVELDNRIICFDIKELGKQLKKLGMLIVQDQVWNRVTINRNSKKNTRYYIDEFHLLLKEEQTAAYSVEIWKRFRKWGGVPTGITQNIKDLLASREIENIFENSDFIYMLNQASGDRQILAKQLNISPFQLSYVTNSNEGEGLLFYGNTIIPFKDKFDTSLKLYSLMTTKPNEMGKYKEKKEA